LCYRDPRIRTLLERITRENGYIAAICAAPKVLARAGLLAGRRATGYPGVLDPLNLQDVTIDTAAVVQDGQVITSRGPGTAMDFALALISILAGKDKRAEVEAGLVR
jgi:4-methyl-5(b-hydroxyethyl)-thiazole monophosphate biosynthesis